MKGGVVLGEGQPATVMAGPAALSPISNDPDAVNDGTGIKTLLSGKTTYLATTAASWLQMRSNAPECVKPEVHRRLTQYQERWPRRVGRYGQL